MRVVMWKAKEEPVFCGSCEGQIVEADVKRDRCPLCGESPARQEQASKSGPRPVPRVDAMLDKVARELVQKGVSQTYRQAVDAMMATEAGRALWFAHATDERFLV